MKLLAVLHTSSAQGRSEGISVEIATGQRRTKDNTPTSAPLEVAVYGA